MTVYGTWLFLIGSVRFAAMPTIRPSREIAYLRLDRRQALARAAEDGQSGAK